MAAADSPQASGGGKPKIAAPALPSSVKGVKLIQRNVYVGSRQPNAPSEDDIIHCQCSTSKGQQCRPEDRCLNRMLLVECTADHCPAGDACQNQRFQRQTFPQTSLLETPGRGLGLVADGTIEPGTVVAEYTGEVILETEAEKRARDSVSRGEKHTYFMNLGGGMVIDARKKGSLARFINHSCDANCRTEKWSVLGETRVGIIATTRINPGVELTYDYQMEWRGAGMKPQKCLCGAVTCAGFLGVEKKAPQRPPLDSTRADSGESTRGSSDLSVDAVSTYSDSEVEVETRPALSPAAVAAAVAATASDATQARADAMIHPAAASPGSGHAAAVEQAPGPVGAETAVACKKGKGSKTAQGKSGAGEEAGEKKRAAKGKDAKRKGKGSSAGKEATAEAEVAGAASPSEQGPSHDAAAGKAGAAAADGPADGQQAAVATGAGALAPAGASPTAGNAQGDPSAPEQPPPAAQAQRWSGGRFRKRGRGVAGPPRPIAADDDHMSLSWDGDTDLLEWYKAPSSEVLSGEVAPGSTKGAEAKRSKKVPADSNSDSDYERPGPSKRPRAEKQAGSGPGWGIERWRIRKGIVRPMHVYFYRIWLLSGKDASCIVKAPRPDLEPEFTQLTRGGARRKCWEVPGDETSYGRCLLVKWSKKHDRVLPTGAQVTDEDTYFKILEPQGPELGRLLDDDSAFQEANRSYVWPKAAP